MTDPISPSRYISAIKELPNSALFTEVTRLTTSLTLLQSTNAELAEYPDDEVCRQAIEENLVTIGRYELFREKVYEEMRERGLRREEGGGHGDEAGANGVLEDGAAEVPAVAAESAVANGAVEEVVAEDQEQRPEMHRRTHSELTIRESPAPTTSATQQTQAPQTTQSSQSQEQEEEEGVYL